MSARGKVGRLLRWIAPALIAVGIASTAQAQSVPAGYQQYIITGDETQVWRMLRTFALGELGTSFDTTGGRWVQGMDSVIALVASSNDQFIYYDHWEDGYDAFLVTGPQGSRQGTTRVYGDSDNSNGRICDYSTDPRVYPCTGAGTHDDVVYENMYMTFPSNGGLKGVATNPKANGPCFDGVGGSLPTTVPVNDKFWRCSVPLRTTPYDVNGGTGEPTRFVSNPPVNNGTVPDYPNNLATTSQIFFDGGDYIATSGGPLAVIHNQDPRSPFIGGAKEILPLQAVKDAVGYTVPIGVDKFSGNTTPTEPLKYVYLNLVAYQDNTTVSVTSPGGAGTRTFLLNKGWAWSSATGNLSGACGANGGTCPVGTAALTINAGTRVSTSGPLNGLLVTSGVGNYSDRHYTLLPDLLHATDYVISAAGDDPNLGPTGALDRPLNLFIFNPDPVNSLTVSLVDSTGTRTTTVNPDSFTNFYAAAAPNRYVPARSTARLIGNRPFWGVSAYDHQTPSSNWGHAWLARKYLTNNYTVPFGPGTTDPALHFSQRATRDPDCTTPPANPGRPGALAGAPYSGAGTGIDVTSVAADGFCNSLNSVPLHVAATENNTCVQIDFDGDGIYDLADVGDVDLDGNGLITAVELAGDNYVAPFSPGCNRGYKINALQSLKIYDPYDYDTSGTRIVTNKPVSVAWGQDTDLGIGSDPILDSGYTVYPVSEAFLDPVITLTKSASVSSIPGTCGGNPDPCEVTYTLRLKGYDYGPLTSVQINDIMAIGNNAPDGDPPANTLTCTTPGQTGCYGYMYGTTTITYPNSPQSTTDPTLQYICFPVPQSGPGSTPSSDPTLTCGANRERRYILTWPLSPDTLNSAGYDESITITYKVRYASSSARFLTNKASSRATFGNSLFRSSATADVVQTNTLVNKTVNPNTAEAGQTVTYTITVENQGTAVETGVVITDPVPPDTTYNTGSLTTSCNFASPLTGTFSDGQNAVVWTGSVPFNTGTCSSTDNPDVLPNCGCTLTFAATVNQGTSVDTQISNQAGYESNTTPYFFRSVPPQKTTVTGPNLSLSKAWIASGGNTSLYPNEAATFEITITNIGTSPATSLTVQDLIPGGTTYVPESISYNIDGSTFTAQTDASDSDFGTYNGTLGRVEFVLSGGNQLGVNQVLKLRFQATVNAGATGQVCNQANASANGTPPGTTNQVCVPITTPGTSGALNGTVFLDYDYDGVQDAGEPGLPNVTVTARDSAGHVLVTTTDANGLYTFTTVATGLASIEVDGPYESDTGGSGPDTTEDGADGDIPAGAYLTTATGCALSPPSGAPLPQNTDPDCNEVQTGINVPNGGTGTAAKVGYWPPELSVSKTSNKTQAVINGEQVTYTMSVSNPRNQILTSVGLKDLIPANTTYVNNSASITVKSPVFRVTEYPVAFGTTDEDAAAGIQHKLRLSDRLASDFFVLVQGADGTTTAVPRGPNVEYLRLSHIPNPVFNTANGNDLLASGRADEVWFTRAVAGAAGNTWTGVITVVECVTDCDVNGFRLRDAKQLSITGTNTTASITSTSTPNFSTRTMLLGGYNGPGCQTSDANAQDNKLCHWRFTNAAGFNNTTKTIDVSRSNGQWASGSTAQSTVMVVDWGSAWTLGRAAVPAGANGGDPATAGTWNVAALTNGPFTTNLSWIWGSGFTNDAEIGESSEGLMHKFGPDGTAIPASTSSASVVLESNTNGVTFDFVALSHPSLKASHVYVPTTTGTDATTQVNSTVTTVTPFNTFAGTQAMGFVTNWTSNANGDYNYPRSTFYAQYTSTSNVRSQRRYAGGGSNTFAAVVQGIDFSNIWVTTNLGEANTSASWRDRSDPNGCVLANTSGANCTTGSGTLTIGRGGSIDWSYKITVGAGAASSITNTFTSCGTYWNATTPANTEACFSAARQDTVVTMGVNVEYNNAGFVTAGGTRTYLHTIRNTGGTGERFSLTAKSSQGWKIELLDTSGSVLAVDFAGDGVWEQGSANATTTTLGACPPSTLGYPLTCPSVFYGLRLTAPPGAALGTQDTMVLYATSVRDPSKVEFAVDETTVISNAEYPNKVILAPDNSGVVADGYSAVYRHILLNNTGAADSFLVYYDGSNPYSDPRWEAGDWTTVVFVDSNGNGSYDAGIDPRVFYSSADPTNANSGKLWLDANNNNVIDVGAEAASVTTIQLAQGGGQILLVQVSANGANGTNASIARVSNLTGLTARAVTSGDFDGATDTTTVVQPNAQDLSGGATRFVAVPTASAGYNPATKNPCSAAFYSEAYCSVHPGTLYAFSGGGAPASQTFVLNISESSLNTVETVIHPVELWVDGDCYQGPETLWAVDNEGDGIWDTINPVTFQTGAPRCSVSAGLVAGSVAGTGTDVLNVPAANGCAVGSTCPTITINAGYELRYELRRPIYSDRRIVREFVTLTSTSNFSSSN